MLILQVLLALPLTDPWLLLKATNAMKNTTMIVCMMLICAIAPVMKKSIIASQNPDTCGGHSTNGSLIPSVIDNME